VSYFEESNSLTAIVRLHLSNVDLETHTLAFTTQKTQKFAIRHSILAQAFIFCNYHAVSAVETHQTLPPPSPILRTGFAS
jgi:hypothetical protein